MTRLLEAVRRLLKRERKDIGHLYYLYGIKPIKPNKSIVDECTVTK